MYRLIATWTIRLLLTLDVQYIRNAELCRQGRVTHHTGQCLPLCGTLRPPHIAHVCGAGAVGLVLGLRIAPPAQLRLPEDLGGRTTSLRYARGHQCLVPAVQEGRGTRGHVDFWLLCVQQIPKMRREEGEGGNDNMEKRLEYEY